MEIEKLCPICKRENKCSKDRNCWCMKYDFPQILYYLAGEASSCICKECLQYYLEREEINLKSLEDIFTRRSVRTFTGESIDDRDLKLILRAGFQAPSAHNREPREYIVVRDKATLKAIEEKHKYGKMLTNAGCGIVVCGDLNKQESLGLLIQDCSASVENMLIAINSLGLGGVWTAIHPVEKLEKDIVEILKIKENIRPIALVALGCIDKKPAYVNRYDESKIHYDMY